jgi:hypothetical protein
MNMKQTSARLYLPIVSTAFLRLFIVIGSLEHVGNKAKLLLYKGAN